MPRPVRFTSQSLKRAARPSVRLAALLSAGKPRRKLATEEHDAQARLFDECLSTRLHPDAVAFAIGNGGKRHASVTKAMKAEGVKAGVPDVEIVHRGRPYFLEMKKPKGGRLSAEQREMMARLETAGAICAVAHGFEAAVRQLEWWGLLLPVTATEKEMAA